MQQYSVAFLHVNALFRANSKLERGSVIPQRRCDNVRIGDGYSSLFHL